MSGRGNVQRECPKLKNTDGEVDFDGGDEADGESGDEYVRDDVVVVEHEFDAADNLFIAVGVQHSTSQQRAARHRRANNQQ